MQLLCLLDGIKACGIMPAQDPLLWLCVCVLCMAYVYIHVHVCVDAVSGHVEARGQHQGSFSVTLYLILIFIRYIYFILCVTTLPVCMCTHVHAWCPQKRTRKGVISPETEVTDSCKLLCGCWELNMSSVQSKCFPVLTTSLAL